MLVLQALEVLTKRQQRALSRGLLCSLKQLLRGRTGQALMLLRKTAQSEGFYNHFHA